MQLVQGAHATVLFAVEKVGEEHVPQTRSELEVALATIKLFEPVQLFQDRQLNESDTLENKYAGQFEQVFERGGGPELAFWDIKVPG